MEKEKCVFENYSRTCFRRFRKPFTGTLIEMTKTFQVYPSDEMIVGNQQKSLDESN